MAGPTKARVLWQRLMSTVSEMWQGAWNWKFVIIGTFLAIVSVALCHMNPGNTTLFLSGLAVGLVGAASPYLHEGFPVVALLPGVIVFLGLFLPHVIAL